jgi:Uma2 family endonuclease
MSAISTAPFTPDPFAPPKVLPLEDGDHMSVEELIRRWEALPEDWREEHKHVELIEGVVRMPPISGGSHAQPHFDFLGMLGIYRWATPGVVAGGPASIILDTKHMPEPDGFLAIDPRCGGRVQFDEKGYVIGAPELLAEISSSSVSFDLHTKKEIYRKFAVKEYVVWRTKEQAIDWFILRGEQFEPLPLIDGVYRSELFPGLWLAAAALIASDFATVKATLEQGLASPEHGAFVEQLQRQKSP